MQNGSSLAVGFQSVSLTGVIPDNAARSVLCVFALFGSNLPSNDDGRGLERVGACGGGEGCGDEERVVPGADSVKTPSSGGNDSVSSDCQPKRTLPHKLSMSSARVSLSDTSEPRPLVVTESERA